jgi:NADPH:quinone reductase-like Zn-dependent oxidoreductase
MKAIVLHEYGGPGKLKLEEFPDPKPGDGEVLVEVYAASINPVDWKMRSGEAKGHFPVTFPGVLGRDAAGVVREVGKGVENFKRGDKVFALAHATYAEFCVVKASELALIPDGLDMTTASAVPLVSVTGDQLIREAAKAQKGQTIVLTGALGSVGRIALYCAGELGVKVIAVVRKKQIEEALSLGATAAIDVDDEEQMATLGFVHAVADTVGQSIGAKLLTKVLPTGCFGSVLGSPSNAVLNPSVQINAITAHPDPAAYVHYGEAIRDSKLALPIDRVIPFAQAGDGQAAAEKGGIGKVVLAIHD